MLVLRKMRSDLHCFKSSAEKGDKLLLCRKVKVGLLKKRKEQHLQVFSVGLCSYHHFLPPSRAGNTSSSTFCFLLCRVFTCGAGHKGLLSIPKVGGNPSVSPAKWEPQPLIQMLIHPCLWPHVPRSLCHAALAQQ